jgi:hypothetical protein
MSESPTFDPQGLSEHAAQNRESWNKDSDVYQEDHGPQLAGPGGPGWGRSRKRSCKCSGT